MVDPSISAMASPPVLPVVVAGALGADVGLELGLGEL